MQELSDDELDDLFRNSMNSKPPFDPEAWNAMEKKLDSENRRRTFYYRIAGLSSLLLLIGLSLVFRNYLLNTQVATTATTANSVQQNNAIVKNNSSAQNNPFIEPKAGFGNSSSQRTNTSSKKNSVALNTVGNTSSNNYFAKQSIKKSNASVRSLNTAAKPEKRDYSNSDEDNYIANTTSTKKHTQHKAANVNDLVNTAPTDEKNGATSSTANYDLNSRLSASDKTALVVQNQQADNASSSSSALAQDANAAASSKADKETISSASSVTTAGNDDLNSRLSASDKAALVVQNQQADNASSSSSSPIKAQGANTAAASSEAGKETISSISSATTGNDGVQKQTLNTAIAPIAAIVQEYTIKDTVTANDTLAAVTIASKDNLAKAQNYNHRWSINLLMNPEYSATKDFDFYKLGFNIGLLGEYYFSPRFSLVAGAIYAKKIYTADGYDYMPAHNYWPKHAVPTTVKATCGIIEIPVNIRYKFVKKQSYALFVSTGLSSYLMLKENYNYQYAVNTPGELTSTQVVNKNRYFFSIYNLSVGIEKYINNNWSVQAEPYLQLPFSGVGEGKIKLISTGMYFSVKYHFH